MGAPKDLNNPALYAEALVRAVLDPDREQLAAWLAGVEDVLEKGVAAYPFREWYLYFADSLLEMTPRPELGFQMRSKRTVVAPKVGRNDPCPCGSGKKYKLCHLDQENDAAWKLATPTPTIRAMAVAKLVHELPVARLDLIPLGLASPVALTEMASVYQANGRLEDALALVKRVLDGDRKDSFLLYDYWIARYAEWLVEAGREKEGEQFLMDEYDNPRQVKQWQVAQKLAAFYIDQGDMENASTWVDAALGGDAKNPFNHYLKGMLAHYDEMWESAVDSYKEALRFADQFREEERGYMQFLVNEALGRAESQTSLEDESDDRELDGDDLDDDLEEDDWDGEDAQADGEKHRPEGSGS